MRRSRRARDLRLVATALPPWIGFIHYNAADEVDALAEAVNTLAADWSRGRKGPVLGPFRSHDAL